MEIETIAKVGKAFDEAIIKAAERLAKLIKESGTEVIPYELHMIPCDCQEDEWKEDPSIYAKTMTERRQKKGGRKWT